MPLYKKFEVELTTIVGLWKIEEDEKYFLNKLIFNPNEEKIFQSISNPKKRLQWLSSRYLIKEILGVHDNYILSIKDNLGRTQLPNINHHLCISHSNDFSSVILSEKNKVGLDIECIHPKIEKVLHRYLNTEELNSLNKEKLSEHAISYWTAKEAIYKWYGEKELNFKGHIFITPFSINEKKTKAIIRKNDYEEELEVNFMKIDGYILSYVIK